jgi:hypothetical protein
MQQQYSEAEMEDFGTYLLSRFFMSRGNEEYMNRPIAELVKEAITYWKAGKRVGPEGEKMKVLIMLSKRGETTKSYLQKALFQMTPKDVDNSINELLISKFIVQSNQNPEAYQITKEGATHLQVLLEAERRIKAGKSKGP